MATQNIFDQLFIFVNLHQHVENQLILSVHSSDKVNFKVPSQDWPHPFLTMFNPNIFYHSLICVNLHQHAKNQLISPVHSGDTVSPETTLLTPIFDHVQPKNFRSTFNFCELVSTCKKIRLVRRYALEKWLI